MISKTHLIILGLSGTVLLGAVVWPNLVDAPVFDRGREGLSDPTGPVESDGAQFLPDQASEDPSAGAGQPSAKADEPGDAADIDRWFPNQINITLGGQPLIASVADTVAERQLGLSDTPALPPRFAKLFVFETSDTWGFWMKDMNYAIDIVWLDEAGRVIHIAPDVSPASYPDLFIPAVPARYVIEVPAGFMAQNELTVGTLADLSALQNI